MEIVKQKKYNLKQIFIDNWQSFIRENPKLVNWNIAYNVWKIINCREPDGLGYSTFACPQHPEQYYNIPHS